MLSMWDKCDDCDMDDALDLLEFALDMACATVGAEAAVLAVVHMASVVCGWSILDPLGVVWPEVKRYSSASPEWDDPLSGKS